MTIIALGDTHCPFHDKRALEIAYQIITDIQPDTIVLMGDMVDMYAISSFSRDPKRSLQLQNELDATNEVLKQIDALTDATVIYLEGNHEQRLQRYLRLRPELHDLASLKLERLLGLDTLGWQIKSEYKSGDLLFVHGRYISKHSAYSIKRELEARAFQVSMLMGHTHRIGNYNITGYKSVSRGYEIGCLCKEQEYISAPNRQIGFAVVTGSHVEQVMILKGKTIFRGKVYR